MTAFTEEQLREFINGERHVYSSIGRQLAIQCLASMDRERAALARAEAAESLLREVADDPPLYKNEFYKEFLCAWCEAPGPHHKDCQHARISAHFACQQTIPAPEASVSGADQERDALRKDIKTLKEALAPFARVANEFPDDAEALDKVSLSTWNHHIRKALDIFDFRRARAELQGKAT